MAVHIKVDNVEVYNIIEQFCSSNQLIAKIQASRTDSNTPHLRYLPYNNDEVYNYIFIDDTSGKITLSSDGVDAINRDYQDISNEITSLNFKVRIKDTEQDDEIVQDISVGVVRIHDENPRVIDKTAYKIYKPDVTEGYLLFDIRTMYPAYFYAKNEYFEFKHSDIGRATLTPEGLSYFENELDENQTSIIFPVKIVDQFNNLEIDYQVECLLINNSHIVKVPKKSILDETEAYVAKDTAGNVEYIREELHYDEQILKTLMNNSINAFKFDENNEITDIDKTSLIFNSFDGESKSDTLINDEQSKLKFDENIFLNESKNNSTFSDYLDTLIDNLNKNNYKYNVENLKNNNWQPVLLDVNNNNGDIPNNESLIANIIETNYFNLIKIIDDKINRTLNRSHEITNDQITEVLSSLSNLLSDYATFKRGTYCKDWNEFQRKHISEKNAIKQISNILFGCNDYNWENLCNDMVNYNPDSSKTFLTRIINVENLADSNENRIENLENRHLENWGASNRWEFKLTNSNGYLNLKDKHVINYNLDDRHLYFGNDNITNLYLRSNGTSIRLTKSGGAYLDCGGSSTVKATTFDGTATRAKYADIAERYEADNIYDSGTILAFGGEKEVTIPSDDNPVIIGIVSTNPGILLNNKEDTKKWPLIALKGRVPVNVKWTNEYLELYKNKTIKKGSKVYASKKFYGYATTNALESITDEPVGILLHDIIPDSKINQIEVFVK